MTFAASKQDLSGLDDGELIARVVRRDVAAFEALMRRHNRLLYRTARAILRDDHEAEDCVQEAYLRAFQHAAEFRSDARVSTWLVRIVVNQALQRIRKQRQEPGRVPLDNVVELSFDADHPGLVASATDRPDAEALRSEWRALLERHIDALPAAFKPVFVLRALEDLTVEETAACLDIPEATVRTRFFRARGLLREAIARDIDLAMEDVFEFLGARCDRIVSEVLRRIAAGSTPRPAG